MRFSVSISRFVGATKELLRVVPRKIVLDLFSRVVLRTPVDTGRARGNWQANTGAPMVQEADDRDTTGSATVAAIANEVGSWDVENVAIYLVNNVPYIVPLEEGSSTQAANGMVMVSMAEIPDIVEEITRGTP